MTGFKLRYHIHFHLQVFNLGIYDSVKIVTGNFFKNITLYRYVLNKATNNKRITFRMKTNDKAFHILSY